MNKLDTKDNIKNFVQAVRERGEILAKSRGWQTATFDGVRIDNNGKIFAKFILAERQTVQHIPVSTELLSCSIAQIEETYKIIEIPILIYS